MKILSIGKKIQDNRFNIVNIGYDELLKVHTLDSYDYILISGGDGLIRRTIKILYQHHVSFPPLILNASGSFNVIAKLHRVPHYSKVLDALSKDQVLQKNKQTFNTLNDEVFLFSAGNMGDLQHIALSETLRFGVLKKGIAKYMLSVLFLLPVHLIMTPFMLLSQTRFFIFTPASFIKKFGSFYGVVEKMEIDLQNGHNHIELDGDVVTIEDSLLRIAPAGSVDIVTL